MSVTLPTRGDVIWLLHAAVIAAIAITFSFWWSGKARAARSLVETGVQTTCEIRNFAVRSND